MKKNVKFMKNMEKLENGLYFSKSLNNFIRNKLVLCNSL